jgi:hypothetical protein
LRTQEVILGVALLLLSVALFYPVFAFPIIDLAIAMITAGVVVLIHGYGLFNKAPVSLNKETSTADFTPLDRAVLEMISQGRSQEEIVRSTGVSPDIITAKSAALSASGYISGNRLT